MQIILKKHQEDALVWLRGRNYRGILVMAVGTGKTFTALAAVKESLSEKTLVVTTKATVTQWIDEAARFGVVEGLNVINYEKLLNDDTFKKLEATNFDFLICDEVQKIKSPTAKTSKRIKKIKSKFKVAMSATPSPNHIHELWNVTDFLYPGSMGKSFFEFRGRHCVTNPYIPAQIVGYRNKEALISAFNENMFFVGDDVLNLPEKKRDVRWLDLLHGERVFYNTMRKEGLARFATGDMVTIPNMLVEIIRLSQYINARHLFEPAVSSKESLLAEVLSFVHKKTIVFSDFSLVCEHLHAIYKGSEIFIGRMSSKERDAALYRFKEDPTCDVIFMSSAGSAGLNMQHAKRVVHFSLPPHDAALRQRLGRARRLGQTEEVEEIFLIAKGTVEEKLWEVIQKKKSMEESITRKDYKTILEI